MLTRSELLQRVETHIATLGMPAAVFGKDAVGDPNLVRDLRNGRDPREPTRQAVLDFIEGKRPPHVPASRRQAAA